MVKESTFQCRRRKRCRFYPWVSLLELGAGRDGELWFKNYIVSVLQDEKELWRRMVILVAQ